MTDTVDELKKKYGVSKNTSTTSQKTSTKVFDSKSDLEMRTRLSKNPAFAKDSQKMADSYKEIAEINLNIAELAEDYGKLNIKMKDLIGKKSVFTVGDILTYAAYKTTFQNKKARQLKIDAYTRKGENIGVLVEKMAETLVDQINELYRAKEKAAQTKTEVVDFMKQLDRSLVDTLRSSYTGTADRTKAETTLKELEVELADIQKVLTDQELKVQEARAKGDLNLVLTLTNEMSDLLDIKEIALDKKLGAEDINSTIRQEIMNYAATMQDVKASMAVTRGNYVAANVLYEAVDQMLIKYENIKEFMIPTLKHQASIVAQSMFLKNTQDLMNRSLIIGDKLLSAYANVVKDISVRASEMIKTPVYDIDKARLVEADMKQHYETLVKLNMEWADAQQSLGHLETEHLVQDR